ncbi:uroporphyrinogen decarboxylase family protein [Candidatus Latescibacterota bacterium]
MNSLERVVAALRGQEPDRVPIVESVVDMGVRRALFPEAAETGAFSEAIGLDAVGCGMDFGCYDQTDETYRDEWGVTYRRAPQALSHPVQGPISSMDDLLSYEPPDPQAPGRLGALPDLVARYKGKRAITVHHRAAFMWSAYLAGLDQLLLWFALDPELAHGLLDRVLEANIAVARRCIREGAEVVILGDDYAQNTGPMMSPAHFDEFVAPRLARMVEAIHEEGALCVKHTDGNIWSILDSILATGIDAINPLEPVAGMDIGKVKAYCGDRVCLMGNIDCGQLLSHGSEDEVREAVRECIAAAAPGGGFILSSSNSIHSSVRPENYLAMVRAGQELGAYPLDLD